VVYADWVKMGSGPFETDVGPREEEADGSATLFSLADEFNGLSEAVL
jgi:hypothetical protein